ncbi:MAG: hypothetical protein FJZ79_05010 [Chlorobi bacterium]|nr:hypothetical protein [Chlorobiota bacterium]
MEQTLRPLGTIMQLLEELGHEVTYAYEDLVFVNHSDFLLQFGETGSVLNLFFNSECPKREADLIEESLIPAADRKGLSITTKGRYTINEQPDENLQIRFFDF